MESCWSTISSFWLSTCGDREPNEPLLEMLWEHSQRLSHFYFQILAYGATFSILPNHFIKHSHPILYTLLYFIIILFFQLFFIIFSKTPKCQPGTNSTLFIYHRHPPLSFHHIETTKSNPLSFHCHPFFIWSQTHARGKRKQPPLVSVEKQRRSDTERA